MCGCLLRRMQRLVRGDRRKNNNARFSQCGVRFEQFGFSLTRAAANSLTPVDIEGKRLRYARAAQPLGEVKAGLAESYKANSIQH